MDQGPGKLVITFDKQAFYNGLLADRDGNGEDGGGGEQTGGEEGSGDEEGILEHNPLTMEDVVNNWMERVAFTPTQSPVFVHVSLLLLSLLRASERSSPERFPLDGIAPPPVKKKHERCL